MSTGGCCLRRAPLPADWGRTALAPRAKQMSEATTALSARAAARVAARVADEPGFAGCALPEVDVVGPPEGVAVRVLATDLDDVAANLIRNAWRAGATRTAIMFVDEDDPITGLAYLALRFLDDGDATLTISDIQRRSPTRGLGLVSDLVARHDGFVAVEQDADEQAAGWSKAVVVRLLRAESELEAG